MLKGKNVIITGCNRGIGNAVLKTFAQNGANIWAHARKETPEYIAQINQLSQTYQVEIWPVFFDMTDYEKMKEEFMKIRNTRLPIDALVNNAGIMYNTLFQMSNQKNLREQFEVNFFSVFILTQYVSKIMTKQKFGSIVNIASTAALDGNAGKSVYGASKAAVICMTNVIAEELGAHGVRANCIAPGITETDLLSAMPGRAIQESKERTGLKRAGSPSEIAQAALFLVSDASSYITGQVMRVDGGLK